MRLVLGFVRSVCVAAIAAGFALPAGAVLSPSSAPFSDSGDSGVVEYLRFESGLPAGVTEFVGNPSDEFLVFRITLDAGSTGLGQFDFLRISTAGTTLPFSDPTPPGGYSVAKIDGPGAEATVVSTAGLTQGFLIDFSGGDLVSQELLVGAPSLPVGATIAFDNWFPPLFPGPGFTVSFTVIPEPGTGLAFATGLALLARRRGPVARAGRRSARA